MLLIRLFWLILLIFPSSWSEIGRKNTAIREANKAYATADYESSVEKHLRLSTEFNINEANLTFNLALSYHYNNQLEEAQRTYSSLFSDANKTIASFASNQVGVIQTSQKKYQEALESFKFSLIKDPRNEEARYNYELLSRWLQENPDQENQDDSEGEDQENQDEDQNQENQDQQKDSKDSKDGEGDEKSEEDNASESEKKDDKSGDKSQEERDSDEASDMESDLSDREKAMEKMRERLQEMNLTPEQAAQILEAMNAAELRFIQQNRKKATQRPNRGLPEW
ncbi:hypothetical protein [Mongoliitalea lutea]|uniref:Tetratricopeptide repeat-containing protein n=1 Tax=Mongoliitalea lutea TaxID=849756 RepID=A0A8J3G409_9BACT|nr:hypothetical protein [Mongoliitalea lutea]GHB23979.1 hypothetical protein GCM10008106_00770 [Mongoliitalea lutea]